MEHTFVLAPAPPHSGGGSSFDQAPELSLLLLLWGWDGTGVNTCLGVEPARAGASVSEEEGRGPEAAGGRGEREKGD